MRFAQLVLFSTVLLINSAFVCGDDGNEPEAVEVVEPPTGNAVVYTAKGKLLCSNEPIANAVVMLYVKVVTGNYPKYVGGKKSTQYKCIAHGETNEHGEFEINSTPSTEWKLPNNPEPLVDAYAHCRLSGKVKSTTRKFTIPTTASQSGTVFSSGDVDLKNQKYATNREVVTINYEDKVASLCN